MLLRLTARLVVPLAIASFALTLFLQLPRAFPLHNPFAAYLHLMPGQRFVRDSSMECYDEFVTMHPDILNCTIIGTGNLRYIYISSKNAVIEYVGFSVTRLRLGDVEALYGDHDSLRLFNNGFTVQWDDQLRVWGRQRIGSMLAWRINYISFN